VSFSVSRGRYRGDASSAPRGVVACMEHHPRVVKTSWLGQYYDSRSTNGRHSMVRSTRSGRAVLWQHD